MFPYVRRRPSVRGSRDTSTARMVLRRAGSAADIGRIVLRSPFDSLSIAVDTRQTWLCISASQGLVREKVPEIVPFEGCCRGGDDGILWDKVLEERCCAAQPGELSGHMVV
jgi:hypothetical protein